MAFSNYQVLKISLLEYLLEDLPEFYKYEINQKQELLNIIREGPVDVPEDETGENWKN